MNKEHRLPTSAEFIDQLRAEVARLTAEDSAELELAQKTIALQGDEISRLTAELADATAQQAELRGALTKTNDALEKLLSARPIPAAQEVPPEQFRNLAHAAATPPGDDAMLFEAEAKRGRS